MRNFVSHQNAKIRRIELIKQLKDKYFMTYPLFSDEYFMNEALKEAKKAFEKDEIPVGAVIVCRNTIIARAHNMTEELNDATAHAEMMAITAAENYIGSKFLDECSMFVTLEPCSMCASASSWAHLTNLVYGASDPKGGYTTISEKLLHPKAEVKRGVLNVECGDLLREFFRAKRNSG